jgi:hypothetical protein
VWSQSPSASDPDTDPKDVGPPDGLRERARALVIIDG